MNLHRDANVSPELRPHFGVSYQRSGCPYTIGCPYKISFGRVLLRQSLRRSAGIACVGLSLCCHHKGSYTRCAFHLSDRPTRLIVTHRPRSPRPCRALAGQLEEPRILSRLHANCGVEFRNFLFPLDTYPTLVGFGANNDQWIKAAVELGELAVTRALEAAGITAADTLAIFFASVTGIASPTIDARLINRMPFPPMSSGLPSSDSVVSLEPLESPAPPTT